MGLHFKKMSKKFKLFVTIYIQIQQFFKKMCLNTYIILKIF